MGTEASSRDFDRDFDAVLSAAGDGAIDREGALLLFKATAGDDERSQARRTRLFETARHVRERELGNVFHHTGGFGAVLPCSLDPLCRYCPYWSTSESKRMSIPQLVAGIGLLVNLGVRSFHLSGGSQPGSDGEEILEVVRAIAAAGYGDLDIYVNCGASMNDAALREMRDLGVKRVGAVFEITNPKAFAQVKPGDDLQAKFAFAEQIGQAGLELGSGLMAGLGPQETRYEDYVDGLFTLRRFPHLTSVYFSKFTPEPTTPMRDHPACSLDEAMCLLAVGRLVLPRVDLSPAAGWRDAERFRAIEAGAGTGWFSLPLHLAKNYFEGHQGEATDHLGEVEVRDNRLAVQEALAPYGVTFSNPA